MDCGPWQSQPSLTRWDPVRCPPCPFLTTVWTDFRGLSGGGQPHISIRMCGEESPVSHRRHARATRKDSRGLRPTFRTERGSAGIQNLWDTRLWTLAIAWSSLTDSEASPLSRHAFDNFPPPVAQAGSPCGTIPDSRDTPQRSGRRSRGPRVGRLSTNFRHLPVLEPTSRRNR